MSVMCNVNSEFAGKWLGGIGEANPFDAAPAILQQPASACESASESKRVPYSDPDNYDRNLWLYEHRAAGKKNKQILDELSRIAYGRGFAPIESENALRAAIESYAEHEGLPKIDGQRGRPRTNSRQATKRKSTGE